MELQNVIQDFLADLSLEGRQQSTITKHAQELHRLARWLADAGQNWQQLTRRDLQSYTRARTRELASSSAKGNMLTTLRCFFRWAVEQELIGASPAAAFKTPRRPRPVPKSLTFEQVRRLVAHLDGRQGRTARRDRALLLTALYAGLRAQELARLHWSNVDLEERLITVRLSKMNHGRVVPIHPALVEVLRTWRSEQEQGDDAPVFSGPDGQAINGNRVGKIARAASRACGVKFSAHVLRHTYATWCLRRSKDLYGVSKLLGHQEVRQTEIYVSADVEDLRSTADTLPAPDAW